MCKSVYKILSNNKLIIDLKKYDWNLKRKNNLTIKHIKHNSFVCVLYFVHAKVSNIKEKKNTEFMIMIYDEMSTHFLN